MAERTRPRLASSSEIQPPSELPATCGRSSPSWSRNSLIRLVSEAGPGGVPGGGIEEAPNPGRSSAITSRCGLESRSTGSQTCQRLPIPWISTSGGPEPARLWFRSIATTLTAQLLRAEASRSDNGRSGKTAIPLYKTAKGRRRGMASTEQAVRTEPRRCRTLPGGTCGCTSRGWARTTGRDPDHRSRRGVLRLRRARQALPRRAVGAVLREHRARARRHRPGRGRPGEGPRVLHELVLRASAGDRARRADRVAGARRPQPRVLHRRRQRGRRVGAEARAPVPQAARQAEQVQGDRARDRLPRHVARRAVGDRDHRRCASRSSRSRRAVVMSRTRTPTGCRRG